MHFYFFSMFSKRQLKGQLPVSTVPLRSIGDHSHFERWYFFMDFSEVDHCSSASAEGSTLLQNIITINDH